MMSVINWAALGRLGSDSSRGRRSQSTPPHPAYPPHFNHWWRPHTTTTAMQCSALRQNVNKDDIQIINESSSATTLKMTTIGQHRS